MKTARVIDANRFMLNLLCHPLDYFLGKELCELGLFRDRRMPPSDAAITVERLKSLTKTFLCRIVTAARFRWNSSATFMLKTKYPLFNAIFLT